VNESAPVKTPVRYTVATAESQLTVEAQSTLHSVHSSTSDLDGFLELSWNEDGALATDPQPKMHVEFPIDRLRSGNPLQDREMQKFIDATRFPKAGADLREVQALPEAGHYNARGDITLAGRYRTYEGGFTLTRNGDSIALDGELSLDIRDFGLRPPSLLMLKIDPVVKVRLQLVARSAA
jgi:hypothetical protein